MINLRPYKAEGEFHVATAEEDDQVTVGSYLAVIDDPNDQIQWRSHTRTSLHPRTHGAIRDHRHETEHCGSFTSEVHPQPWPSSSKSYCPSVLSSFQ